MTLTDAFRLAVQHHQAGRLAEAEGIYRQIIAAAPDFADAWQLLGALALQVGQPQPALELIDKAISLTPAGSACLADYQVNRGEALRSLGRRDEAIAALRAAIAINPDHVAGHNNLGIVLHDLGRHREAVTVLERAIALRPEHVQAQNNLALSLRALGRHDEAFAAFGRALALNPEQAEAHYNRADLARIGNDGATALAGYRRTLDLKPTFSAAYYGYFLTLLESLKAAPLGGDDVAGACVPPDSLPGVPEFSVVVCSHRPERHAAVRQTFARALAGSAWELQIIADARSLAEAYNRGVAASRGRILIFSHDDVEVLNEDLPAILRRQLADADLLGIAGTDQVVGAQWQDAGWPHLHGLVCRPLPEVEGGGVSVCLFGTSAPLIGGIQAIDGCFFAARRELLDSVAFDAATFDGFHLYDIDFSYAAHLAGKRVAVSTEIVIAHASPGNYDAVWQTYASRFVAKYQAQLPASAPIGQRYFPMATLPDLASTKYFADAMAALRIANSVVAPQANGGYQQWIESYERDARDPAKLAAAVAALPRRPLLSVLMPICKPDPARLAEALDSVLAQAYPDWELCIADAASSDAAVCALLDDYARRDARIRLVNRPDSGRICAAANDALALAAGEFIALLDHHDVLPPHALYWLAQTLVDHPDCNLIYSDEDKIDAAGRRSDPHFKPSWNPDFLLSQNFISRLAAYRTSLVREAGGFRPDAEGAHDYDLVLHISAQSEAAQIRHVPRILYHWRTSAVSPEPCAQLAPCAAGERVLNEHLARSGAAARAEATGFGYRVRYTLPLPVPRVTMIMPTRDGRYLRAAVDSLYRHTDYPSWQLLIVDNGSEQPETLAYLAELAASGRAQVLRDDRPFNYSALNNVAAATVDADILLFINDDIEATHGDWLREMVSHAQRPEIGAVGAMLRYPDGSIQHAGVLLIGGLANHAHLGLPKDGEGYFGRDRLIANFAAVTGACLALERRKFELIGGFDEQLAVAFNDVDLCLRLGQQGFRNLWTPYSELIHHESVSRGQDSSPEKRIRFQAEVAFMKKRWRTQLLQDHAYNPNLSYERLDFSLAWPPRLPEFVGG